MKWDYDVTGVTLLQTYLYTYSLLRGITFEVLPLSSYALSPVMLPLLQTFLELPLWNSFQCCHQIFFNVLSILKSLPFYGRHYFWKQPEFIWSQIRGEYSFSVINFSARNCLTESDL